jgi:hypothetical protein
VKVQAARKVLKTIFLGGFLFFLASSEILLADGIEKEIGKLKPHFFCINSNLQTTWETTLAVLKEMGIETTLQDDRYHVITTAFVFADSSRLWSLAKNARPFLKGRFTLKFSLEEVASSFTRLAITLQIRQNKAFGKKERLLKTRGTFETFSAYRINQLAIAKQFPDLYEIRLGMDLIPDIARERYQIRHVESYSPAGEAGFLDGDWLEAVDGKKITLHGELFDILLSAKSEKEFRFQILRGTKTVEIPVWVIRVPEMKEKLGIHFSWDGRQRQFVVTKIKKNSRAEKAGILPGDRVLEENGILLDSWINYYRALARWKGGKPVYWKILRGSQVLTFTV